MSTTAIVKDNGESQDSALDDYISKKGISVDKLKEITQNNSNSVPTLHSGISVEDLKRLTQMRLRGERIVYDLQISPEDALRLVNSQSYTTDQRLPQAGMSASKGHPLPYYYPNHPSIQSPYASGFSEQSPYSSGYSGQLPYSSGYSAPSAYRRNPSAVSFTRDRPISMVDSWNQGYRLSRRNEADSAAPSSFYNTPRFTNDAIVNNTK